MKRIAIGFALFVCSFPLFASQRIHLQPDLTPVNLKVEQLSTDPAFAAALIEQSRLVAAAPRPGVGAEAIINNSSSRAVLIPAAGSLHGGGNTFFRSDITMVDWNTTAQDVAVIWIPNGGTAITYKTTFPGDRPPFTQTDFVGTLLNQTGLGSLFFIPITSTGAVDTNGAIDVFSRIWTPQPNATGTVSQPFSGVDPDHLSRDFEAFILGLRQDAAYRTNFGIVNLSNETLSFTVTVYPESAAPGTQLTEVHVTLAPLTMTQQGIPGAYTTGINLGISIDSDVNADSLHWSAYASSTDNITGDGWVSIASRSYDDDSLDTAAKISRRNH